MLLCLRQVFLMYTSRCFVYQSPDVYHRCAEFAKDLLVLTQHVHMSVPCPGLPYIGDMAIQEWWSARTLLAELGWTHAAATAQLSVCRQAESWHHAIQ